MCLYHYNISKCSHPECIYINNVKTNFRSDYEKNAHKLSQIELKHNWSEAFKENKMKLNENDRNSTPSGKYELKKHRKSAVSGENKDSDENQYQFLQVGQFIDSELKILLNQNVTDFILQLGSKYAKNLKQQNTKNEQHLQSLEKRLQQLQNKSKYSG